MVYKQLDLTDLYQRLKLVIDTWIDTIPFQTLKYQAETSTYSCDIDSNVFNLFTYRDRGLPSSSLTLTRIRKEINGLYSDLVFSVSFKSYCRGKVEFEITDELVGDYNSDWHAFTRKIFYPISNSQQSKLYESLSDLQLGLQYELRGLEKEFSQPLVFEDLRG